MMLMMMKSTSWTISCLNFCCFQLCPKKKVFGQFCNSAPRPPTLQEQVHDAEEKVMGDFSYFSCCWFQVAKLFLQSFKFSLQPSSLQEQVHDTDDNDDEENFMDHFLIFQTVSGNSNYPNFFFGNFCNSHFNHLWKTKSITRGTKVHHHSWLQQEY